MIRAFYAIQAALVPAWWAWVLLVPSVHDWFFPVDLPPHLVRGFLIPDLLVLTGGSLLMALRPRVVVAWCLTGGWAYAAMLCLAWWVRSPDMWPGMVAMLLAAALNLGLAVGESVR